MHINSIVILSLAGPKERIWGQLMDLSPAGVTMRGVPVEAFDEFIQQIAAQEEGAVCLSTVFYPMHRVERIALDEPTGSIPSLADRFRKKIGVRVEEYFGLETPRLQ